MREEGTEGTEGMDAQRVISRKSRRSFLWSGASVVGAYGFWRWLLSGKEQQMARPAFRSALGFNERLWEGLYGKERLSPTFAKSQAKMPRANGHIGLDSALELDSFRLRL